MNAFDKLKWELRVSFGEDVAIDPDRLAHAIESAVKALIIHTLHIVIDKDEADEPTRT